MIETQATVTALEGDYALVEASQSGCGRCHETGGCGGNNGARLFCHAPRRFRVRNPLGARVGERVSVGVADGAILRSAAILYVLPLACLLAGALAGALLLPDARDGAALVGALVGSGLAWRLAVRLQRRSAHSGRYEAVIRQRL